MDQLTVCKRMMLRHERAEPVRQQRARIELGFASVECRHAKRNVTALHETPDMLPVCLDDAQRQLRMALTQRRNDRRKQKRDDRPGGRDGYVSAWLARERADLDQHRVHVGERAAQSRQELATCRRQRDTARGALDQHDP
jgi:hypothetical protein